MRPATAACALALVLAPAVARAASWPEWVPPLLKRPPETFSTAQSVVLLDEYVLEVSGGKRTGTRHWASQTFGAKDAGEFAFWIWRDAARAATRIRMLVRRADGSVEKYDEDDGTLLGFSDMKILDDQEFLVLRPPHLQAGDAVAVQHQFRYAADLVQDVFPFQWEKPVLAARVVAEVRDTSVVARTSGGTTSGPVEVSSGPARWEFTNIAPVLEQTGVPKRRALLLALNYARPGQRPACADWNGVARFVADVFQRSAKTDSAVTAEGDRARGSADPFGFIAHRIRALRYFGVEIGRGAIVPRDPATVLARALGDCKDKTNLMVVLLRRAGIEAIPVLISAPDQKYVDPELPSPWAFNHAIVGIPWSNKPEPAGGIVVEAPGLGRLRLFDPTPTERFPLDVPLSLEGARALAADPRTTGLLEVPASSFDANRSEILESWSLAANGALQVSANVELRGARRMAILNGETGEVYTSEELKRGVTLIAENVCPHPEQLSLDGPSAGADSVWHYSYRFTCPDALAAFDDVSVLRLEPPLIANPFEAGWTELDQAAILHTTWTIHHAITLHSDIPVRTFPPAFDVAGPVGRVAQVVTHDGEQAAIDWVVSFTVHTLHPEQRNDLLAVRRAFSRAASAVLVFDHAVKGGH